MSKYDALARFIVEKVGGKDNIKSVFHCMTRLRFYLKDTSIVDAQALENHDEISGVTQNSGQYQVIIGTHVGEVCQAILDLTGLSAEGDNESAGGSEDDGPKEKTNLFKTIVGYISSAMAPLLSVLTASGVLKGLLSIAAFSGWISKEDGLYALMNGVSDALFYFFPVLLGYTAGKRMKIDPFVGAVIGAALMYPTLQNNEELMIFGRLYNISYTSTVIPILITIWLASYVYHFVYKHTPNVIKNFFPAMVTIGLCAPFGFLVIGPIANIIADGLANGVMSLYALSPTATGAVIGGCWQLFVMLGLHTALASIAIIQIVNHQPTPIFGLNDTTSFAQMAVTFVVWLKTKDEKLKKTALPAWASAVFGVTEPAIYGVTIQRPILFAIASIASAIGGAYAGHAGLLSYRFAGMGIFGFSKFFNDAEPINITLMKVLTSWAITIAVAAILTLLLYKDHNKTQAEETSASQEETAKQAGEENLYAPIKGQVRALDSIDDEAFSKGLLGEGIVIEPSEGSVYAPTNGQITTVFPTLHAIGMVSDLGVEVLIHVGMNTVEMKGEGFEAFVKEGDRVEKGQKLLDFDIDKIKEAGHAISTPVVITNTAAQEEIDLAPSLENVDTADIIMTVTTQK